MSKRKNEPLDDEIPPVPGASELPEIPSAVDLPAIPGASAEEILHQNEQSNVPRQEIPLLIFVEATGLSQPLVSIATDEQRTTIKFDCAKNKKFSATVTIPLESLLQMVEKTALQYPTRAAALLVVIKRLRALMKD